MGPPCGIVEHCATRLGNIQNPRLGTLQQCGQPWVSSQDAQRRAVPTEDHGVQLRGTGQ
jgi:hypothetical protein